MSRALISFVLFIGLIGVVSAAQLSVIEPVTKTLKNGDNLDLGVVGPGQKVAVIANRPSGEISRQAAGAKEALWDRLLVEGLPSGWIGESSKLYENPFQAFVTISPDASDGEYVFSLRTLNEYDNIPTLVINAKVRVSKDVLGFSVKNRKASTGVDQPAILFLTLQNTGSASDVFELSLAGLPSGWSAKKRLFVPHNSAVNIAYEIVPKENGEFTVTFKAVSLSNSRIFKEDSALLKTETSVWNDVRTSANGILLFPSVQQSVYAGLAFLAHLIG